MDDMEEIGQTLMDIGKKLLSMSKMKESSEGSSDDEEMEDEPKMSGKPGGKKALIIATLKRKMGE